MDLRADVKTRPRWQYAVGLVLLAAFAWWAFVRGVRVPVLGWIDLAIHEFGHVVTSPLPDLLTAAMGSGTQVLVPLGLAGVFLLREHDLLGASLTLGWAATSLQDASVYIADAPYQDLPLIGGYHDWAFVLSEIGRIDDAAGLARIVWTLGLLVLIAAAGVALAGLLTVAPAGHPAGLRPPVPSQPVEPIPYFASGRDAPNPPAPRSTPGG